MKDPIYRTGNYNPFRIYFLLIEYLWECLSFRFCYLFLSILLFCIQNVYVQKQLVVFCVPITLAIIHFMQGLQTHITKCLPLLHWFD